MTARGVVRMHWPDVPEFPELRPFERQVALLLVGDAPCAEVARLLGVGVATVSTSKCRLLAKLEVNGVAGLARLAVRRGYVQP